MNFLDTPNRKALKYIIESVPYLEKQEGTLHQLKDKVLRSETFKTRANLDHIQLNKLFAMGIDAKEHLKSALSHQIDAEIENALYSKYVKLGEDNFINNLTKWESFLLRYFPSLKFSYYIGNDNSLAASDNLIRCIFQENYILSRSPNTKFLIVSPKVFSFIAENESFISSFSKHDSGIMYNQGHINGIIIFISTSIKHDDTNILLGTMTNELNEGVVFLEGEKKFEEYEDYNSPQKKTVIQLEQRAAISDIGDAKGYFSYFNIKFSKKPLWRKILNIR